MESADQPGQSPHEPDRGPSRPAAQPTASEQAPAIEYHRRRSRHHEHTPRLHRLCDSLTEGVLYFMVVFGPWAFGTTQVWSTWVMNGAGYCLGALLMAKWVVRWRDGYRPGRWGDPADQESGGSQPKRRTALLTRTLAALTILILAYILVSALNARATYFHDQRRFDYRECIQWLPHSYDSRSTWFVFWQYLGLAWFFWALRDWLLTQTSKERHHLRHGTEEERSECSSRLPARLRRLLWVVCLNGTALAVECILQRLDGTNKLLWLVEPRWNKTPESQFGPYAYRSNAAQYLNLVWPLCVGFWWRLRQRSGHQTRMGSTPHVLLPVCIVVIGACPMISLSRGAALIMGLLAASAATLLLTVERSAHHRILVRIGPILLLAAALGAYLVWPAFKSRLAPNNLHSGDRIFTLAESTVLCAISVPTSLASKVTVVAGVSSSRESPFSRSSLVAFLDTDGSLKVRLYGQASGDYVQREVRGFLTNYVGLDVRLALIRTTGLSIFVNGNELSSTELVSGSPPAWNHPVETAAIWVGRRNSTGHFSIPVLWLSVFDRALGPSELQFSPTQISGSLHPTVHLELDSEQGRSLAWALRNMNLSGREVIYRNARRIAEDFPLLGTGPGSFASIYQLYLEQKDQGWEAYVHDDWLETQITFGWVGFTLILASLLTVGCFWFFGCGVGADGTLFGLITLSLFGCLVHAKFDFPLQVYSILHLFLLECVILTCLSRTR
jgi:hypothetical protein